MYEMYRMLGKEHDADLQREAGKWQRASEARGSRGDSNRPRKPSRARAWMVGFLVGSPAAGAESRRSRRAEPEGGGQ